MVNDDVLDLVCGYARPCFQQEDSAISERIYNRKTSPIWYKRNFLDNYSEDDCWMLDHFFVNFSTIILNLKHLSVAKFPKMVKLS